VTFLLDTNVVSEWTKPRPNAGVIEWLSQADEDEVFERRAQLLDQPCKELRLHLNEQCDDEADGHTHNRSSTYSARKHLLFAVCHFTPP
jgi:hypothetical protein